MTTLVSHHMGNFFGAASPKCLQIIRNNHAPWLLLPMKRETQRLGARPSICLARFSQMSRTLGSSAINLIASLYLACRVPAFEIVWLTKMEPAALGLKRPLLEST